ncbi:MAG: ThuA domain-containing protein [Opitutaceae bacterium]|nr:ThuA domain-containing protein [Opitutaceae bacterium]
MVAVCYSGLFRILFLMVFAVVSTAETPLKVLFFSKSSGWEHDVIKRGPEGEMSYAEKILARVGSSHDMVFTFSKDGSKFSPRYLAEFDVMFFYASGNLTKRGTDGNPPMSQKGKEALLEWIAQGGGFVAVHAGSDCFHTYEAFEKNPPKDARGNRYRLNGEASDPYIKMLGGEFINHGPQQVATARVIDSDFPGYEGLATEVTVKEEWYSLKEFAPNNHLLLVMETAGMEGKEYDRPNYPLAWARPYGNGRVWFNAMGHREDVWDAEYFQNMLVGGIEWAGGKHKTELMENVLEESPQADVIPPQ